MSSKSISLVLTPFPMIPAIAIESTDNTSPEAIHVENEMDIACRTLILHDTKHTKTSFVTTAELRSFIEVFRDKVKADHDVDFDVTFRRTPTISVLANVDADGTAKVDVGLLSDNLTDDALDDQTKDTSDKRSDNPSEISPQDHSNELGELPAGYDWAQRSLRNELSSLFDTPRASVIDTQDSVVSYCAKTSKEQRVPIVLQINWSAGSNGDLILREWRIGKTQQDVDNERRMVDDSAYEGDVSSG